MPWLGIVHKRCTINSTVDDKEKKMYALVHHQRARLQHNEAIACFCLRQQMLTLPMWKTDWSHATEQFWYKHEVVKNTSEYIPFFQTFIWMDQCVGMEKARKPPQLSQKWEGTWDSRWSVRTSKNRLSLWTDRLVEGKPEEKMEEPKMTVTVENIAFQKHSAACKHPQTYAWTHTHTHT